MFMNPNLINQRLDHSNLRHKQRGYAADLRRQKIATPPPPPPQPPLVEESKLGLDTLQGQGD
ncbi:hypothetical protein Ddye_029613 [Dipteronia dyeriana]|uniref:Uncharacterized protein n=1 Tax=Dipteronia dyeriana TaxID=168575 RepID=A0AAD9TFI5_9ROSI|nr:hypothetical protein Ddye_029613 [Dipteronia dyeriana]